MSTAPNSKITFLTVQEMAVWLKKSSRSVYRDVQSGALPKPFKVGGTPRWSMQEVLEFLERRRSVV